MRIKIKITAKYNICYFQYYICFYPLSTQLTKNLDFLSSSLMANINNPTRMLVFTSVTDVLDQSLSKIIEELILSFIFIFKFFYFISN